MTSLNVIKDETGGQSFIPASQRPDGTWRKPIRVRDGYVPQEEQPVYVSKGKQFAQDRSQCPVGMTMSDVQNFKASNSNSAGGSGIGYFEVGNYEPTPTIPGLNFIENLESSDKPKGKSKKSKSKSKGETADGGGTGGAGSTPGGGGTIAPSSSSATSAISNQQTDPSKRLRNLKKRLKEIEALEQRIASGEVKSPEKEQLEKIQRKDEVLDEIDELELLIGRLTV